MAQCTQNTCARAAEGLTFGFQNHLLLAFVISHNDCPQTIRIVIDNENIKIYASKTFSYQPFATCNEPIGIFNTTTFLTIPQAYQGASAGSWEWKYIEPPRHL